MSSQQTTSLAILDDYAGIALPHFQHLDNLKIDTFPDTLNAATEDGLKELTKRLQPYQLISSMRERTALPAALINNLPNLKYILTTGARNASIDIAAAKARGIPVTGATGGGDPVKPKNWSTLADPPPKTAQGNSVNQHTWATLLSLCSRIPTDHARLNADSTAWQSGLAIPLGGKTMGLVGLGKLGTLMATTAILGFGMKVVAWSQNLTQEKADESAEKAGLGKGAIKVVGKEELFKTADVVSLHLVLSDRSRGVVGEKELDMMKKSALLVNASRGGLIDEQALLKAVREGSIRGVALDVYWIEPLPKDSPWREQKDFKSEVVFSPHMGYVVGGTMNRFYEEQAENIERWQRGEELLHVLS